MPRFEVFIPAADAQSFNVTFRVDAANWMAALKTGMQKIGEQGATTRNVLVDVQDDNGVHVTEPVSGRVFQIRELTDAEAASAQLKHPAPPQLEILAPPPAPSATPTASEARTELNAPTIARAEPEPMAPVTMPTEPPPPAPVAPRNALVSVEAPPLPLATHQRVEKVVELERPTRPVTGRIGREKVTTAERDAMEDILADVFERVADVSRESDPNKAIYFLLDLALDTIPAESGAVLRADGTTGDLRFIAARGPKAKDVLDAKLVVPNGVGIAGFCAMEGVCVALSDVEKDPRYYPVISERVGYETRSVLAAPMMTHGRAFGCFQILNKRGDKPFTAHELGILSYLAHQGAIYLNDHI